jgi:hypothetical protein
MSGSSKQPPIERSLTAAAIAGAAGGAASAAVQQVVAKLGSLKGNKK